MGKKLFTLSFDDGTVQDVRFVELLNKLGLKCTFNLNSGHFGWQHRIVHGGIDCDHSHITADMVQDLYRGHEVAAHTVNHPSLLACAPQQVIHEVRDDALALEQLCGYQIVGMAYPGGPFFNEDTIRLIRENTDIVYARAVGSHFSFHAPENFMAWYPTCDIHDKELFPVARQFLEDESDKDLLFYVWGHTFEFDKYDSWARAEEFLRLMSGREDILYVTNREAREEISTGQNQVNPL